MRRVQYKITAPGHDDGMICTYEDGALVAIDGIHKLSKLWQDICINAPIPLTENEIPDKRLHYDGLVTISELELSATDAKIAAFCAAYIEYTGIKYRVLKGESKSIAGLPITQDLLKLYFNNSEWWGKQPKSIRNLASNFNALLQLKKQPSKADQTTGFPDQYDAVFEKTLQGKDLSAYWKHLRKLGLEPKRNGMGQVVDWTKAAVMLLLACLLLSGCMTDRKVTRYLADHPHLVPSDTDTILVSEAVVRTDTFYVDGDTIDYSWDWKWIGQDTGWMVHSLPEDRLTLQISGKDTAFVTLAGHQKQTRFRVISIVKPDTIIRSDTVYVDKPVIHTRQVIVKPKAFWQFTWFWVLIGFIALLVLLWPKKSH